MRADRELLRMIRRDDWRGEPGEVIVVPLGREARVRDLALTKHKTEIVDGQLVVIGPSGFAPACASGEIFISLAEHERYGGGLAIGSRVSYLVDLPHRRALCPDVSWYTGAPWETWFPHGAPVFEAEVRAHIAHGPAAEERLAARRADYFAAGTQVVWDVDVLGREDVVRVYRASAPENPAVYRSGDVAEAEPAVPGWRMPVDEVLDRPSILARRHDEHRTARTRGDA